MIETLFDVVKLTEPEKEIVRAFAAKHNGCDHQHPNIKLQTVQTSKGVFISVVCCNCFEAAKDYNISSGKTWQIVRRCDYSDNYNIVDILKARIPRVVKTKTEKQKIEMWLPRIYTRLHKACGMTGFCAGSCRDCKLWDDKALQCNLIELKNTMRDLFRF
jgi:hypothetical protein